jgi:pectate lyase
MTKDEFIQQVLHILNEAGSIDGTEMIGADMTNINVQIEKLFPTAYRRAIKILPRTWFDTSTFATSTVTGNGPDGTGYIVLPSNYITLSSFKMQGWKTACLEAPDETPAINRKQANEYIRGTPQRPVCVLRHVNVNNTLSRALYYYSLPKRADATKRCQRHGRVPYETKRPNGEERKEQRAD